MAIQSEKTKGSAEKKKFGGCFGTLCKGIFYAVCFIVVLSLLNKDLNGQKKERPATAAVTVTATAASSHTEPPTTELTSASTEETIAEPAEIILCYPELGEYGQYYTFNENVEKATEEDKNTIIQCFVPAGDYIVSNEGKYPNFVYVYSKETVISEDGWEEPADGYISPMLQPGESCDMTIKDGYYIKLLDNTSFKLTRK